MVTTEMKKFIGSIRRSSTAARSKSNDRRNGDSAGPVSLPQGDDPEAVVVREAVAFCEAGAPGSANAGDEYLHLPAIVDAAESSPPAAREVALTIQRYLSKQNFDKGYAQYNALMLTRILTDNPGRVFTQNFDKSFVSTVKALLRECRDSSVQQIARETLDYFEAEKLPSNDSLVTLIEMWRKEKGMGARMYSSTGRHYSGAGAPTPRESQQPRGLPPADELAARIEEAKTSARLLVQMVQSTPPHEMMGNDLIKEFSERARQAHKSIQQYMACENPAPDEHTMLTLIETSEQLNIAMTKHQRALLNARKAASQGNSPQPPTNNQDPFATSAMQSALPPPQPPRPQQQYHHLQQTQDYSQYESQDLYNPAAATVSPVPVEHSEHSYIPPTGPPPGRRPDAAMVSAAPPNTVYARQQHEPVSPPRNLERIPSAALDYGVSENPFADDNAYGAPTGHPPAQDPQENAHSLFNRAAGQLRHPDAPAMGDDARNAADRDARSFPAPYAQDPAERPQRPGAATGYNEGWQPTPSFVQRQDSSAAHINMSGATPDRR